MEKENIDINIANEIVQKQSNSLRKAIPQSYVFTIIYGLAWFIGYGALALTNLNQQGYSVFTISLAVAIFFCTGYLIKTLRGVKTISSPYIKYWSMAWFIGFIIHAFIIYALDKSLIGVTDEILKNISWIVGNSIPMLIVSLCLLASATIFKDKTTGRIAVVIAITTMISTVVNPKIAATIFSILGLLLFLYAAIDGNKKIKGISRSKI